MNRPAAGRAAFRDHRSSADEGGKTMSEKKGIVVIAVFAALLLLLGATIGRTVEVEAEILQPGSSKEGSFILGKWGDNRSSPPNTF